MNQFNYYRAPNLNCVLLFEFIILEFISTMSDEEDNPQRKNIFCCFSKAKMEDKKYLSKD